MPPFALLGPFRDGSERFFPPLYKIQLLKFLTFYVHCTWSVKKVPLSAGAFPLIYRYRQCSCPPTGLRSWAESSLDDLDHKPGGYFVFKLYNLGIILKLASKTVLVIFIMFYRSFLSIPYSYPDKSWDDESCSPPILIQFMWLYGSVCFKSFTDVSLVDGNNRCDG